MFVNLPQSNGYISIPDNFFTIVDIDSSENITFEVDYKIRQSDVIQRDALSVRISAITRQLNNSASISNRIKSLTSTDLIRNLLNMTANARAVIKNNELSVVAVKVSDNTKVINNEIIGSVLQKRPLDEIQTFVKRKLVLKSTDDLKQANDPQSVLQVNLSDIEEKEQLSIKYLIQNSILNGIDPSTVYEIRDQILTSHESVNGTWSNTAKYYFQNISNEDIAKYFRIVTTPTTKINTVSTQNISENKNILTYETVVSDESKISTTMTLLSELIKEKSGIYKQLFIKFELLNSSGVVIQTVQKEINLLKHIEIFNTPRRAPNVNFAKLESATKANLLIKQQDKTAKTVRVYRKNFSYILNDNSGYKFVSEYPIGKETGVLTIPVEIASQNSTIYRVIPVGPHGVVSSEFTNVVIPPKIANNRLSFVSLTAKIVENGISIEIREIPTGVVAFQILRKDKTLFEKSFSIVGSETIQVNQLDSSITYAVSDTNVKKEHCYEYQCKLIFRNGDSVISGYTILEYFPFQDNVIETKIENLQIVYETNNLDVKFKISSVINETDLDVVKTLLEKQNLLNFFSDEILNGREKLQNLIAFQVFRVNLTSGQREDFGVLTSDEFSDLKFRNLNNVQPLRVSNKYRYEVIALLRSPETMIENYVKSTKDPTTQKPYVYKPYKFLHPITLTKGNITTPRSLKSHYPKHQMSFGIVGNVVSVDVEFTTETTFIIDATAEEFTKNINVVKWRINGSSYDVDHFLISIESTGQRKIIGKAHAFFDVKNFHFIHEVSQQDIGEVFYVITPVFSNYEIGSEVKTNNVILGD